MQIQTSLQAGGTANARIRLSMAASRITFPSSPMYLNPSGPATRRIPARSSQTYRRLAEAADEFYHWHVEIIPKLTKVAGFEWATGFYVNPTSPEEAARVLREARP